MTTLSAPLWGWFVVLAVIMIAPLVAGAVLAALIYFVAIVFNALHRAIEDCTDWRGML